MVVFSQGQVFELLNTTACVNWKKQIANEERVAARAKAIVLLGFHVLLNHTLVSWLRQRRWRTIRVRAVDRKTSQQG